MQGEDRETIQSERKTLPNPVDEPVSKPASAPLFMILALIFAWTTEPWPCTQKLLFQLFLQDGTCPDKVKNIDPNYLLPRLSSL